MGGNMACRRDAFERAGMWDNNFGRRGTTLRGQEQREWYLRAVAAGLRGYYVPELITYHLIPASRLTKQYFRRWFYWSGVSRALLYDKLGIDMEAPDDSRLDFSTVPHLAGVPRYMFRTALKTARHFARSTLKRDTAAAFDDELWMWFFAGVVRQRWSRPPPAAGLRDRAHDGPLAADSRLELTGQATTSGGASARALPRHRVPAQHPERAQAPGHVGRVHETQVPDPDHLRLPVVPLRAGDRDAVQRLNLLAQLRSARAVGDERRRHRVRRKGGSDTGRSPAAARPSRTRCAIAAWRARTASRPPSASCCCRARSDESMWNTLGVSTTVRPVLVEQHPKQPEVPHLLAPLEPIHDRPDSSVAPPVRRRLPSNPPICSIRASARLLTIP